MGLVKLAGLPAIEELEKEGWRMIEPEDGGKRLRVLILNLMPLKQQTERQLLRRLAAAKPVVEAVLLTTESYASTHVDPEHLKVHYKTFSQVRQEDWDGLIITGAPVEHMDFEEVAYWEELTQMMAWSETHVRSVLHICWGAQAGLYYHYGIPKRSLPEKQFGIYPHRVVTAGLLTQDMEDPFPAPHSRHTYTAKEDVERVQELQLVAESPLAGVYLLLDEKRRYVFVTGHSEYEADTLAQEYRRDLGKGLPIALPYHYFPEDDAQRAPVSIWDRHSETLFNNWLMFYASPV
ncbi:MAG: homoserine O-succinyltransferase [Lachnospiraceae bacterium]|jgi:homoserine O-succinyltransferase|nr:homoserine O-succinyltransferase [Lachnospiraceae bacterium]